ncbi:hypothetical protein [Bradyrhizobium septentrionale]|nr:hypothetical protein [Bradyrhizobium septentrionale]
MDEKMNEGQPIETAPTNAVVDLWIECAGPDVDYRHGKILLP